MLPRLFVRLFSWRRRHHLTPEHEINRVLYQLRHLDDATTQARKRAAVELALGHHRK